jgi:hypothetical protein
MNRIDAAAGLVVAMQRVQKCTARADAGGCEDCREVADRALAVFHSSTPCADDAALVETVAAAIGMRCYLPTTYGLDGWKRRPSDGDGFRNDARAVLRIVDERLKGGE